MSKYTKGPWKIGDDIQQPEICTQDGKIRIAIIAISGFGVSEEHDANAQLIASAPELLEACKTIFSDAINHQHRFNNKMFPNRADAIYKLERAITKAEGK